MTETGEAKKEKLWSRDFIIVMTACSGISFCNFFYVSTLPILARNMTGTTVSAGLITTAFTLSSLATRPISGVLSERIGRVRLLIAGAGLCALACFLYQYCAVIFLLILVRALQGVGFGLHTTAGGAVPADIVPKSRLSEGLGIFGLYGTIASALAPGIALAVIGPGDLVSFRPLFYLSAGIALLCLVLDALIRYERGRKGAAGPVMTTAPPEAQAPACKTYLGFEAGLLLPSAVLMLVIVAFSGVTSFLTLFADDRRLGNIGLFFTISAAGTFLSRVFLGKVADRRGADAVVIPAIGAVAVCLVLIPFVRQAVWLYVIGFPLGLAQGIISPTINRMMFDRCSPRRRGSASAAYFSSIDIGFAVGALLFGFIAQTLDYSFVYWGSAVFAVAAGALYVAFLRKKKKKAPVSAQ